MFNFEFKEGQALIKVDAAGVKLDLAVDTTRVRAALGRGARRADNLEALREELAKGPVTRTDLS